MISEKDMRMMDVMEIHRRLTTDPRFMETLIDWKKELYPDAARLGTQRDLFRLLTMTEARLEQRTD